MKKNWKKVILYAILLDLIAAGVVYSGEESDSARVEKRSGVRVSVDSKDAELFDRISSLRQDNASAGAEVGRLRAEYAAHRRECMRVRNELLELIDKYQKENENFRLLRLLLADAIDKGNVQGVLHREEQLGAAVRNLSSEGMALALSVLSFSEIAERELKKDPAGKAGSPEMALAVDRLRTQSRNFISTAGAVQNKESLQKCRILAVNRELSMVVLPVGQVHGAFNGLLFTAGKKPVTLKVVSVRPFVAAAVVVSGDISELSPGTEAVTGSPKGR